MSLRLGAETSARHAAARIAPSAPRDNRDVPHSPVPSSAPPPRSATSKAVRSIAAVEALKGTLVLLAGAGLLGFLHRDVQAIAERLVAHLHLNPAHHTPQIFLEFASHVDDARLARLAMLAAGYALLRFIEAYGLARERRWAEWFAAISGGVYIPLEIEHLIRGDFWVSLFALGVNVLVVGVMIAALLRHRPGESTTDAITSSVKPPG
jgi:uncharacterized membrane protein (DUF2068 family)